MQTHNEGKSLDDFVKLHGKGQLVKSLRDAHELILYDSSICIDKWKKEVLHDLKILADQIEGH